MGWLRAIWALGLVCGLASPVGAQPAIQHWHTGNGASVLFVPTHELPMVELRVVFDAGAARDGARSGLARLTNRLLDDGAGELAADAIARRLENQGARVSQGSARDMAYVNLTSLSEAEHLEPAVTVVAKMLARPTFPEQAFARELDRLRVGVRKRDQSPGQVAREAFYRAVFGDHPYASPPGGTAESLQQIERADVVDFHERFYTARNAVVAIVGDVARARAEALAETVVGELPDGQPAPQLPAVTGLDESQTVRIPHPSTQTHVLVGQPGMARGDAAYFPLFVGNHVLGGGGLVSVLFEEIRDKRGLSYSVYSYFQPMARRGPFVMGLQTRNEQAEEALGVARETLTEFVREGPDQAALERARKNLTGSFPLRIDSNGDLVGYLAMIGFYDLPLDYLQTFPEKVKAVSREDVQRAFARRLQVDRLITVLVGGGQKAGS